MHGYPIGYGGGINRESDYNRRKCLMCVMAIGHWIVSVLGHVFV
jgi:hypothetical protein